MKALEVVKRIKAAVEPGLESRGFEIIDVEYKREPVGMVLRFYIDHPEGIDLDKCARASEAISARLETSDLIKASYTLEVSSPGLERPLTKPAHFQRFVGGRAVVKIVAPLEGRKRFTGDLINADENGFDLKVENEIFRFTYDEVAKANLVYVE